MRTRLRCRFVLAFALASALWLTGCGEDEPEPDDDPAEEDPADAEPDEDEPDDEPDEDAEEEDAEEEAERPDDVYVVEEGDTLTAIAERFDTTVDELVELNDLDDPDAIMVGEELQLPDDADPDEDGEADEEDGEDG